MSCGSGTLSSTVPEGILLVACACGKWACPSCGKYRLRKLQAELVGGDPITFITLTWDASRPETVERARQIMGEQWKLLVARIKRKWRKAEFEWGVVVERSKNGYPHFHILARAPYIPQAWLSEQWANLVGAPIVDIQAVQSQYGLARYLSKYLTKSPERIGTGKRYWFSQGYRKTPKDEPYKRRTRAKWFFDPEAIPMLLARYLNNGYRRLATSDGQCVIARARSP